MEMSRYLKCLSVYVVLMLRYTASKAYMGCFAIIENVVSGEINGTFGISDTFCVPGGLKVGYPRFSVIFHCMKNTCITYIFSMTKDVIN